MPSLLNDSNGRAIQLFSLSATRSQVTTGDALTTAAIALPANSEWVEIRMLGGDGYVNFGDDSVVAATDATSQAFPSGEKVQRLPPGATHFAVIRAGSDNITVQIEKLK
jgi:hypothetical protein